jgi:hypothetical protein
MIQQQPTLWRGHRWDGPEAEWVLVWFFLGPDTLEIRSTKDPRTTSHRMRLSEVEAMNELGPFDEDPAPVEILSRGRAVLHAAMPRDFIQILCAALALSVATTPPSPAATPLALTAVGRGNKNSSSWLARWSVAAAVLLAVVIGSELPLARDVGSGPLVPVSAAPINRGRPTTTSQSSETAVPSSSSTTAAPTTTTSAPTNSTVVSNTVSSGMAVAPLTGLLAPTALLERNVIVSKIDASPNAMPQVGLELADLIYEVKIEWGSRYLAVWHSQVPAVIGPHRSARTTDPDLLGMFGHPLFAFSGANAGVVQALALTTWKTGVGPGEVPGAWFRDEQRPFPHNLFAFTDILRTRPAPPASPMPVFDYHTSGTAPSGMPVLGFETYPGVRAKFRWDAAIGGWRRRVWDQEHVHANGTPVAPKNVVVLETSYSSSWADANSPEANSVGAGRAWVFTNGTVREGTWGRWQRTDPWNLRDSTGAPLTLDPGATWVVLAEGQPEIQGQ